MLTDRQPPQVPHAGETQGQHAPRKARRNPLAILGLLVVLVAVIAAGIWGVTRANTGATSVAQQTPHATATPAAPRILYQADWSHGTDGWQLPAGAQIVNGSLVINSKDLLLV